MKTIIRALCFRCEYRALWHETKKGPRAECHDFLTGVNLCYMYTPVLPYVTKKDLSDKRPRFVGAILSARERVLRVVEKNDMILKCKEMSGREVFLYWIPKRKRRKL